jgi:hypothetical protein
MIALLHILHTVNTEYVSISLLYPFTGDDIFSFGRFY